MQLKLLEIQSNNKGWVISVDEIPVLLVDKYGIQVVIKSFLMCDIEIF